MKKIGIAVILVLMVMLILAVIFPPWDIDWPDRSATRQFSGWHRWSFQPQSSWVDWDGMDEVGNWTSGSYLISPTLILRLDILITEIVLLIAIAIVVYLAMVKRRHPR